MQNDVKGHESLESVALKQKEGCTSQMPKMDAKKRKKREQIQ